MSKILLTSLVVAFALGLMLGCTAGHADEPKTGKDSVGKVENQKGKTVPEKAMAKANAVAHFKLSGMTCDSCAVEISRQLNEAPGVASSSASFKTKSAEVRYDSSLTTPEKIASIVKGQYKAAVVAESAPAK